MRLRLSLAALPLVLLAACETPSGGSQFLVPGTSYTVTQIDGRPAPEGVTLEVTETGRIAGQAPCNRYFATLAPTETGIEISAPGVTRMACLDRERTAAETAFLAALEGPRTVLPGTAPGQLALREGNRTRLLLTRTP